MTEIPGWLLKIASERPDLLGLVVALSWLGWTLLENRALKQDLKDLQVNTNKDKDKILTVAAEVQAAIEELNLLLRLILKVGGRK